jgi:hypothetical protein
VTMVGSAAATEKRSTGGGDGAGQGRRLGERRKGDNLRDAGLSRVCPLMCFIHPCSVVHSSAQHLNESSVSVSFAEDFVDLRYLNLFPPV